jgi:hypothetical protein
VLDSDVIKIYCAIKMRYKIFTDYINEKENPEQNTKAAIYLNGKKHSNQTFTHKTTLKTLLSNSQIFSKNKLYFISLYYKYNGIYHQTNIDSTYAFLDKDGKIDFYVSKSMILDSDYKKRIEDYILYGSAKKKILVYESNYTFYQIDISSTEIYQQIRLCKSGPFCLVKELRKKLSKYKFVIEDINYDIQGSLHLIKTFVTIKEKKSIISRLLDSLY